MSIALAMTLIAAPVGIGVASTDDRVLASVIADALEREIDRRYSRGAIQLPQDDACKDQPQACVDRARSSLELDEILLLRVFSGVTKHLVIVDGFSRSEDPRKVTVSLPTTGRGWEVELAAIMNALVRAEAEASPIAIQETTVAPSGLWGPALIIASAVVVATASILAERAADARMDLFDNTSGELAMLYRKRRDYQISTAVLFGVSGVLAAAGVVLVLFDL